MSTQQPAPFGVILASDTTDDRAGRVEPQPLLGVRALRREGAQASDVDRPMKHQVAAVEIGSVKPQTLAVSQRAHLPHEQVAVELTLVV